MTASAVAVAVASVAGSDDERGERRLKEEEEDPDCRSIGARASVRFFRATRRPKNNGEEWTRAHVMRTTQRTIALV